MMTSLPVLQESKLSYEFVMVPWARAINNLDNNENVIVYSMARSPEREDKYHWLGEIWPSKIFLYGLKKNFASPTVTMNELKNLRVGTARGSVASVRLKELGFTNIYTMKSQNYLRLLERGRIDLFPFIDFSLTFIAEREGFMPDEFIPVLALPQISKPLSIAMSKTTHPDIVLKLKQAYERTVQSGKYREIMEPFERKLATRPKE